MMVPDEKEQVLADEKKALKKEEHQLSQLSKDYILYFMGFLSPEELAGIAVVAKEWRNLSATHRLWNGFLKPLPQPTMAEIGDAGDAKVNAKAVYIYSPYRRLPEYYPDISTVNEEKGAQFCRTILQVYPQDPYALGRLAFLIGVKEAKIGESDFSFFKFQANWTLRERASKILKHALKKNPGDSNNLYHFGKLQKPSSIPQSTKHYREALQTNPHHSESLCALADLIDSSTIPALPSDFGNIEEKKQVNTNPHINAALLYRQALKKNPRHEASLYNLANAIQAGHILAEPDDFPRQPMPHLPGEQSATLYRKILRHNLNHIEALCALAQLIRNQQTTGQAKDFADSILPLTRSAQVTQLYQKASHIPVRNPKQTLALEELGPLLARETHTRDLLRLIPPPIWPVWVLQQFINPFDELSGPQKDKLNEIIDNAMTEVLTNFNERRWKNIDNGLCLTIGISTMAATAYGIRVQSTSAKEAITELSTEAQYTILGLELTLLVLTMAILCFMLNGHFLAKCVKNLQEQTLIVRRIEEAIGDSVNRRLFFPALPNEGSVRSNSPEEKQTLSNPLENTPEPVPQRRNPASHSLCTKVYGLFNQLPFSKKISAGTLGFLAAGGVSVEAGYLINPASFHHFLTTLPNFTAPEDIFSSSIGIYGLALITFILIALVAIGVHYKDTIEDITVALHGHQYLPLPSAPQ